MYLPVSSDHGVLRTIYLKAGWGTVYSNTQLKIWDRKVKPNARDRAATKSGKWTRLCAKSIKPGNKIREKEINVPVHTRLVSLTLLLRFVFSRPRSVRISPESGSACMSLLFFSSSRGDAFGRHPASKNLRFRRGDGW